MKDTAGLAVRLTAILLFGSSSLTSCAGDSKDFESSTESPDDGGPGREPDDEPGHDAAAPGHAASKDGGSDDAGGAASLDAALTRDAQVGELDEDAAAPGQWVIGNDAGIRLPSDAGLPAVDIPNGSVPQELVGVWQETRSSSSEYENEFGETFSSVDGFSVQLKIDAEGKYYLGHYTSGVSNDCASVTQFDQSRGSAVLEGNVLTLQPVVRHIDISDCENSVSGYVDLEPIVLTVRLSEDREYTGGMRIWLMHAEGFGFPLDLTSLFRPPTYVPVQPEQPAELTLGTDPPYAEIQGMWVAQSGTDRNFYDPDTDAFYFPELNGSAHRWLAFDGENYETAVALQNVSSQGVCELDLIYYERGQAVFSLLEDVGGQGSHFIGHTAFYASDSRLIVNVRECDEDDGAIRYDLDPLVSYYRWTYFNENNPPESFSLNCDYPLSEWQSLLCGNSVAIGYYRE